MYRVGVYGNFGGGRELFDGQTVKTKTITEELISNFGLNNVIQVDTYRWKRNPLNLLIHCFTIFRKCENIIILPAQNGVKLFVPFFSILNKIFRRRLLYVVVGGWLPEFVEDRKWLLKCLYNIDHIFVETSSMQKKLSDLGLKHVSILPNFKKIEIVNKNELSNSYTRPYKLCTFSRVTKEKGIEDAINVVQKINTDYGQHIYTLDIYGQIDENYKEKFEEIISHAPSYIKYKGTVPYDKVVEVLKDYYLLLFPTYYAGEGFAGTLIDAFASGLPVVASDCRYNSEIVKDKSTGLIFPTHDNVQFEQRLLSVYKKEIDIIPMKYQCLLYAAHFDSKKVIRTLIRHIK